MTWVLIRTPPGQIEQFLFSVPFHATAAGQLVLTPTLSNTPGLDYLLYGYDDAVSAEHINFMGTSVTIVPEPNSVVLAAAAAGALAFVVYQRRRK